MDNEMFRKFIGLKWNVDVTESHIKGINGVRHIRVLKPNSPMTMDLRHDRANIFIEEDDTIINITMG